jgi:hypothetical protein
VGADPPAADATRLAKAIQHPLRMRIFFEYRRAPSSPSRIAKRLGEPLNLVAYHTRMLERLGCVRPVCTQRRGGSTEHFFEVAAPPVIEDDDWSRVPARLRRGLVTTTVARLLADASTAAVHGGFDRPSAHLSSTPLALDDEATAELAALLRKLIDDVERLRADSARRGDELTTKQVIVLFFDDLIPIAPA